AGARRTPPAEAPTATIGAGVRVGSGSVTARVICAMEACMTVPASPGVRKFPVSVKGVAVQDGKVLLLENERHEWELPGGKLEVGEAPGDCVVREIREEAGWDVTVGSLLDCWQYHIREGRDVVIVTYGCHVLTAAAPAVSSEHKRAGLFARDEVPG